MGLNVVRNGSSSTGTECGERKNIVAILVSVIVCVILAAFSLGVLAYLFREKRKIPPKVCSCLNVHLI